MWLYLTIFFFIVLLYVVTINTPQSKGILMAVMSFLAIFVGISDMLGGYDRYIYGACFDRLVDVMRNGGDIFSTSIFMLYGKEFGYVLLNMVIGSFTANRYIFILIVTLLIYSCLYVVFKRHTNNYVFATILFLGLWFFFSFTYLRQVLGVCISWLALKYVVEHNLKRFLIVVFIAATIHNSAIMMLLLYFIPVRAFDKSRIMIVMGILFLLGISGGPAALFDTYAGMLEDERAIRNMEDETGTRFIYVIEAISFLYVILKNYDVITETREQTVMTNAALLFCGILLFFVNSHNGGRISWFYVIGIISTLTYIATREERVTKTAIVLIFLSFFLYVRVYSSWQTYLNLYPYKTFFTNGYREGDFSWQNYEYDHMYDIDKFYR